MANVDEQVKAIWSEVLQCDDVDGESNFFDQGGTSIAAVYLAAAVQERLGVGLDAVEVVFNPTFSDLAALLAERLEETP